MTWHRSTILLAACVTCLGWTIATSHQSRLQAAITDSWLDSSSVNIAQAADVDTATAADQPILQLGSSGAAVEKLQTTLKQLGFYNESVNGNFETTTQTAVSQFQTSVGLLADGVVGKTTWIALEKAQAEKTQLDSQKSAAAKSTPKKTKPKSGKRPWLFLGISVLVVIVGWWFIDGFLIKWFRSPKGSATSPSSSESDAELNPVETQKNRTPPSSNTRESMSEQPEIIPGFEPQDFSPLEDDYLTADQSPVANNGTAPRSQQSTGEISEDETETPETPPIIPPDDVTQHPAPRNGVNPQTPSREPIEDTISENTPIADDSSALVVPPTNALETDANPNTSQGKLTINPTGRLAQPKKSSVEKLMRDLTVSDPRKRRKAIWELAQRGDSRAVQPLVDLMMESDSKQRSLILEALSQIGTKTIKPMHVALAVSMQDENAEVRKNAIRDLTRIYELMGQINHILSYATNDPDPEVRETAKWAMSQLGSIRPVENFDQFIASQRSMNSSDNSPHE